MILEMIDKAMEQDPEATAALIDLATYSLMCHELEVNKSVLQPALLQEADKRVRAAKAALGRTYVAKAASGEYPDLAQTARWLAGIDRYVSKALEDWLFEGKTVRREVNRDAQGRFAPINNKRNVVGVSTDAFKGKGNMRLAKPAKEAVDEEKGGYVPRPGSDPEKIAAFQGAYEQAVKIARQAQQSLPRSADVDVKLRVADNQVGDITMKLSDLAAGKLPEDQFKDLNQTITGISIGYVPGSDDRSNGINERIAGFNSLGGMFGTAGRAYGANEAGILHGLNRAKPDDGRIAPLLYRMGVAGNVLSTVNPASKVGAFAQLVGVYGPEAAVALTPHIQRSAYRYRGTERTPDAEITDQIEGRAKVTLNNAAKAVDSGDMTAADLADEIADGGEHDMPLLQSLKVRAQRYPEASGDSLKLGVRSDVAALELAKTIPNDPIMGKLSAASGHVLPSQGVLIDSDGDVVSQSVGFSDDHYLPFNLKKLSKLRGGQYVRTRQQGGLTGEDIFATIYSGARSATVVSGSGMFRLEMAPDFRGGRGMSDKAQSMYDRYLRILDALDKSDLYSQDIDPQLKTNIETDARRLYPSDETRRAQYVKDMTDKKRAETKALPQAELDKIKSQAIANVDSEGFAGSTSARSRAIESEYNDLLAAKQGEVSRTLDLNAEGYAIALETLKQQFPYFIRSVEYEALRGPNDKAAGDRPAGTKGRYRSYTPGRPGMGFAAARGVALRGGGPRQNLTAGDQGYVRPGQLTRAKPQYKLGGGAAKEKKAGEGAPTPPVVAGGGAPAPGERPAAPTVAANAPQADTSSPAAVIAGRRGQLNAERVSDEIDSFFLEAAALWDAPLDTEKYGAGYQMQGRYDAFRKMDREKVGNKPADIVAWYFARPSASAFSDAIEENPDDLFTALASSEKNVRDGINKILSPAGIQGIIDEHAPFDAKNSEELYSTVRRRAMDIVELSAMATPLVVEDPSDENQIYSSSLRAIAYDDIANLDGADAVMAFEDDNPELTNLAVSLGREGPAGEYRTFGQVAEIMANRLDAYAKVKVAHQRANGPGAPVGQKLMDILTVDDVAKIKSWTGLDEAGIAKLANLDGSGDASGAELARIVTDLQRARTLYEVARLNNVDLPEGAGVRPGPKEGRGLVLRPPVAKVGKASQSRPVVRLASSHPAARGLAARVHKGLPPLSPLPS